MRHNFPAIIGCLDCTHVAIFLPGINDVMFPEHIYVNKKGYNSINVQLICDADLKILNVCSRYPGSTLDAYIWNNSQVSTLMRNLHNAGHKSYSLLGDSGYPLRSWLLTPVDNPEPNTPAFDHNICHRQTKSLIEQCNGVLKSRFRCLFKHRVLHYKPNKASLIINACVVLHNICIENKIPEVELDPEEINQFDFGMIDDVENHGDVNNINRVNPELQAGRIMRQQIIRTHVT